MTLHDLNEPLNLLCDDLSMKVAYTRSIGIRFVIKHLDKNDKRLEQVLSCLN